MEMLLATLNTHPQLEECIYNLLQWFLRDPENQCEVVEKVVELVMGTKKALC
jgi:hypothetical protein